MTKTRSRNLAGVCITTLAILMPNVVTAAPPWKINHPMNGATFSKNWNKDPVTGEYLGKIGAYGQGPKLTVYDQVQGPVLTKGRVRILNELGVEEGNILFTVTPPPQPPNDPNVSPVGLWAEALPAIPFHTGMFSSDPDPKTIELWSVDAAGNLLLKQDSVTVFLVD